MTPPQRIRLALQPAVTKTATYSLSPTDVKLNRFRELVVTLNITSAERDTGDETYDIYVTTSDGVASWDLCHFLQIATTGAKTYVMRLFADIGQKSVANNGAETVEASLLTSSTHAIKTLASGSLRHGPWGHQLGYELVVAGTVVTGIAYSITVEGR